MKRIPFILGVLSLITCFLGIGALWYFREVPKDIFETISQLFVVLISGILSVLLLKQSKNKENKKNEY